MDEVYNGYNDVDINANDMELEDNVTKKKNLLKMLLFQQNKRFQTQVQRNFLHVLFRRRIPWLHQ